MERNVQKDKVTWGIVVGLFALLVVAVYYDLSLGNGVQPVFAQLKTFSSYEELMIFLRLNMEEARRLEEITPSFSFQEGRGEFLSLDAKSTPDHSTTNVQVSGVDEADVVKTDGEFLYVVSGSDIYILKAYPPKRAKLLSKIELEGVGGTAIYLSGDKLAVLGGNFQFVSPTLLEDPRWAHYRYPETFIKVYDIADRANPILTRSLFLNGTLSGSRMIEDYLYVVVNQPATRQSDEGTELEVLLPRIHSGTTVEEVQPTRIRYVSAPDIFYYFTTVIAVNVSDDAQEPTSETILTGQTSLMYVSLRDMYLVVPNTNGWILRGNAFGAGEETLICRVKLDSGEIILEAEGTIAGYVLNQFSMDEYEDFFRIATTKWTSEGSKNSLFVLDMDLDIIGVLEDLAPGERIYSARFMGDRCYLVTFRQVDPFFVIDVSSPAAPEVLGHLKIPGYSSYLHPYDEGHIIGIGKQDNTMKLSLFDVTNVTTPTEIAKYIVQADWSDSPILTDHKALLFDKAKQLLTIPISTQSFWSKNAMHWQGAYVFDISLEHGFIRRGKITHQDGENQFNYRLQVKRVLYIENVLYTISDGKIKMNHLESLAEIMQIELP